MVWWLHPDSLFDLTCYCWNISACYCWNILNMFTNVTYKEHQGGWRRSWCWGAWKGGSVWRSALGEYPRVEALPHHGGSHQTNVPLLSDEAVPAEEVCAAPSSCVCILFFSHFSVDLIVYPWTNWSDRITAAWFWDKIFLKSKVTEEEERQDIYVPSTTINLPNVAWQLPILPWFPFPNPFWHRSSHKDMKFVLWMFGDLL
jgi:hypothetical protein